MTSGTGGQEFSSTLFFFNLELSLTRKETQEINSKRSAHILSKVHLGSFTRERKSKKGTAEGNFCTFQTDGESVQNRQKTVRVWGFGCGEGKFQFSSVAQSCPSHCDPMDRSTPGLPVHHQLPEFTHTHVPGVSDAKFNKVYPLEISQHPPRPKPPRLVIRRGAICSWCWEEMSHVAVSWPVVRTKGKLGGGLGGSSVCPSCVLSFPLARSAPNTQDAKLSCCRVARREPHQQGDGAHSPKQNENTLAGQRYPFFKKKDLPQAWQYSSSVWSWHRKETEKVRKPANFFRDGDWRVVTGSFIL